MRKMKHYEQKNEEKLKKLVKIAVEAREGLVD